MKIVFVNAFLLAVAASQDSQFPCNLAHVETLIRTEGNYEYWGVPPDEETFRLWCINLNNTEDNWGNYTSSCLCPLHREVIGLMAGSNEVGRQLCVRGSEARARYFEHVDCLSDGAESDEFKATLLDLQTVYEKVFDVPYKQKFPLVCCGFRRFSKDLDAMTAHRCGQPAVEIAKSFMYLITTELPDTICQKFEPESEECQNLLQDPGNPPKFGEFKSQLAERMDKYFYNDLAFSSKFLPSYLRRFDKVVH